MRQPRKPLPLPILLVLLSFLAPSELSLYLADLRLPPHRVALLLIFPFAIYRLLFTRAVRIRGFDIFFVLFNIWTVIAYAQHGAETGGFVYGGSVALESLGAYVAARAYIRDKQSFFSTLWVFFLTVTIACLIALPETLFGQHFLHDALKSVFGGEKYPVETRLGLTRAAAVFDHPIHYGTYCAGLLALVLYAERRAPLRTMILFVMCLATFTSLSSAPMLCAGLQIGLVLAEYATRGIKDRMLYAAVLVVGLYIGVSLVSTRSPIALIATGLTIDSWTGYYRLQIWDNGMQNVYDHPVFGIGLADWSRPWWMVASTVDALWLVIAMRTGIPALVLVAIAIALLTAGVTKATYNRRDPHLRQLATGWLISMMALVLIAFTVHFWNVLYTFLFFFLGMGAWMADPQRSRRRSQYPFAESAYRPAQLAPAAGLT